MKIRQIAVQIIISILLIISIYSVAGGFVFSHSSTYVAIFLFLIAFSGWMTTRIQIFFLMPKILPFLILLHLLVVFAILYVCNNIIGGITVTALHPGFVKTLGLTSFLKSLGDFGTIGTVSLLFGSVYQVLNWLNSEK